MSCPQAPWLHGYFDGELDAARAAEFEAHLPGCAECSRSLAAQQELRRALRAADLYAPAPPGLRARLRRRPPVLWPGLAAAASLAVLSLGLWHALPGSHAGGAGPVLDAHLRSLQLSHLTDVTSTDQHTVKPWFDGKLDFAPPVADLAASGFPLLGGRLDVVDGRTVAALVYGRRKHVINVFVAPSAAADAAPVAGVERGYAWTRWTRGGMSWWAISDAAPADLAELARLLSAS